MDGTPHIKENSCLAMQHYHSTLSNNVRCYILFSVHVLPIGHFMDIFLCHDCSINAWSQA